MDKRTGKKKPKAKLIKQPEYNQGKLGITLSSANAPMIDYPIFCLKHLAAGYTTSDCNKDLRAIFASKLYFMAQQSWTNLENGNHKTGAGFEKIPKEQIKAKLPSIVTEDVMKLHVIRFNGKTGRIIGLRSDHIFHITHIEVDKSAYDHGS